MASHPCSLRFLPVAVLLTLGACAAPIPRTAPTATASPTATPAPTLAPMDAYMKGVRFLAAYTPGSFPASDWMLREVIRPIGANWILIADWGIQETYTSTRISRYPWAATRQGMAHVTGSAHALGMRVLFETGPIQLTQDPEHWGGDIGKDLNDAAWEAWFQSYSDFILEYAVWAQAAGVDMFSVGSEMSYAAAHRPEAWRALVARVREVYHGPVIYSADSSERENWLDVTWWDAVDAIGIHPFNQHLADSYDPTVSEMVAAWTPAVDRLEALSTRWNRPVVVTELGYPSQDGAAMVAFNPGWIADIDLQEQADAYRAAFEAFAARDWFRGFFWFYFNAPGNFAGPFNPDHTPYEKPAEDVLREYYGGAPRLTPTPVPTPGALNAEDIYVDEFARGWASSVYGSGVEDHELLPVPLEGRALAVSPDDGSALTLRNWTGVDPATYDWLEFSILASQTIISMPYYPDHVPVRITVSIYEQSQSTRPFLVDITESPFIEGGRLEANRWQRVRIPMDIFGPAFGTFFGIEISNCCWGYQAPTYFIDNIRLLGD